MGSPLGYWKTLPELRALRRRWFVVGLAAGVAVSFVVNLWRF